MSVTSRSAEASAGMDNAAGTVAQSCPRVTLEIGVFFDGTGNNAANVRGPSSRISDSYNSALSNVVLLHDRYIIDSASWPRNSCGYAIKRGAIYKQGIGTTAGESDWWPTNKYGAAVGMGPTGVESRVYAACLDVGTKIMELSPGVEPEEVVLDVFGFSRGAAAARYFVNCFRQGYIVYNGNKASLPEGRNVRIRFVGVFDTVAAIGDGTDDDNGDVNVHMKTAQADAIMHLTAEHEYRTNFRLNHNHPGGGPYQELPGAHSDIGGGYSSTEDEVLVERARTRTFYSREQAEAARAVDAARALRERTSLESFYVSEGWIEPGDPQGALRNEPSQIIERRTPGLAGLVSKTYTYTTGAWLKREVQLGLSRIALAIMHDKALAASVPLDGLPGTEAYTIPGDLQPMATILRAGGRPSEAMKRTALRKFGHMSSNYDSIGMAPTPAPNGASGFKRVIYWNEAGKAK
ncbi:DUF2235 domain-containing protein [Oceanicola sp. D3]|uniref:T6SS phospholipase effector Tle1-like catalytic domain-containing protein n=1 Tax=Oceanicola sp. D3 TaxID=2587163 RepID=UPI00111E26AE|nr:DUF2235 domain-containing protein [Oceanicola sp. D3]QDC09484.1 DUF2235 domain-containing protein [Oceanicola sp. D3]